MPSCADTEDMLTGALTPLLSNAYAAMELLVSEVSTLLKMLDQETLSSSVREKKTSVWNLLQQIKPSGGNDRQEALPTH